MAIELTPLTVTEKSRTYHFKDGGTFCVRDVTAICVRPSGTHRLETLDGRKWIVPSGWYAIELDVAEWTF